MAEIFQTIFYKPILSALIFIYNNITSHDLGLAVIVLTVLVRIVLLPLFYKSAKDQVLMQKLQPRIKKIQTEYKNNKTKQAEELLNLYREHKFNPFSGIFLLILQLPVFIALFQLFSREVNGVMFDNHSFLGLIDLGSKNLILVFLAGILQYLQGKLSLAPAAKGQGVPAAVSSPLASSLKTMVYIGPIFTIFILNGLPSAIALYWVVSTVFSIGQQVYINKKQKIN